MVVICLQQTRANLIHVREEDRALLFPVIKPTICLVLTVASVVTWTIRNLHAIVILNTLATSASTVSTPRATV